MLNGGGRFCSTTRSLSERSLEVARADALLSVATIPRDGKAHGCTEIVRGKTK
jgi:hypothetical protein